MKRESKFLSFVLRHKPEEAGITLGPGGWVNIETLLVGMAKAGHTLRRDMLLEIVRTSDKRRFTISPDGVNIRAAQGHSVPVDLGLTLKTPPDVLYHGTAQKTLAIILEQGLRPQGRQNVHLSADIDTATTVGKRHGVPVILAVDTGGVTRRGDVFWQADNGVWLSGEIAPEFLTVLS